MPVLTPQQIQDQRLKMVAQLSENARESAIRANTVSEEYRSNLISIHDKLILISVGSVSLLLTFVGVLFASEKSTSSLSFKWLILAVIAFLISPALMLISRWMNSVYLYASTHKYYMQDLKKKEEMQIKIFEDAPAGAGINSDTYEVFTVEETTARITQLKTQVKKLSVAIKKDKSREKNYELFAKIANITSYIMLLAAYVCSIVFFIGVVDLLNK